MAEKVLQVTERILQEASSAQPVLIRSISQEVGSGSDEGRKGRREREERRKEGQEGEKREEREEGSAPKRGRYVTRLFYAVWQCVYHHCIISLVGSVATVSQRCHQALKSVQGQRKRNQRVRKRRRPLIPQCHQLQPLDLVALNGQ